MHIGPIVKQICYHPLDNFLYFINISAYLLLGIIKFFISSGPIKKLFFIYCEGTFTLTMILGSGCGTDDSAVASGTRGPQFESSYQQHLLNIFTVNDF